MIESLSQRAYRHIQKLLLNNEMKPNIRVSEQRLAIDMGISRTPVREAIRRLQEEGVLYQRPSSGTYVAQPSRKQIIEMFEMRLALEGEAVRYAARRMTRSARLELSAKVEQMREAVHAFRATKAEVMEDESLRHFLAADLKFHRLLMETWDNAMAHKVINDVHVRHAVFGFRTHRRDLHHVAWVLLYHSRVAAAVHRRDARAAQRHLRAHIRKSLRDALASYDAQDAAGRHNDRFSAE